MGRCRFEVVERLAGGSSSINRLFLCKGTGPARRLVKVLPVDSSAPSASNYPTELHRELAGKGLAPKLLQEVTDVHA